MTTKAKQTILEQAEHLRKKGYTCPQIATEFNEQGLKTMLGRTWKDYSIAQMLRDGKRKIVKVKRQAGGPKTSELIKAVAGWDMPVDKKISILEHLV